MAAAARYTELRADSAAVFGKIGSFLADLCEGSQLHANSAEVSVDTKLGSFHETFSSLQARHVDQNLTVAVLALTKSGKSTLLNSLIGANCLPANNVPETARITQITHTPGQAVLVDKAAEPIKTITGEEEIKAYLRHLNSEARARTHLLTDETFLDLSIPIAALQGDGKDAEAAQPVTISLLDTPGPNEAGETALKAQVERLLDSVDAVIYLLDYTKLKTADEAEVLQRLKDINPQLIARLSQRLFFVVNKADMIETSEGMDAEATKEYVADLITRQMWDKSFQLSPDQVLLVSAQHALVSRLVLQGKADKDTSLRFGRLAFGSRARKFSPREHKQAAEEMLAESGVAELESRVLAFLYAHSGSLKMLALLDDTVRMLSQIKNVAAASNAALQRDVASLQSETQEMQDRLQHNLQSFDTVQQEAQAVEGEVVDEVQQRMQRFKERLFRDVTAVLEPSRLHPAGAGRWQEAWHRAACFLNRRPGHSDAHKQELQNKLYELHAAISSSIEAEVREFWQDVEAATNERQRAMFQCINKRLESLSRDIEQTVGQVLDVRLQPVTIAMDPPAAQDFHDSLQSLFAQGIRQRCVTRSRQRHEAYTVWEPRFRNGLCRTGQYFVGRPANRPVTEHYQQPVYDLQPQHIKEYFIALVDGTIEASVKYVREYVHAYLSDVLEDARGKVQTYGQSFNATMVAALQTRQQGEEVRTATLAATQARLRSANKLLREVQMIQRDAEDLCPGQHSISDVISEFSLDEPESSHAGPSAAPPIQTEQQPAVHAEGTRQCQEATPQFTLETLPTFEQFCKAKLAARAQGMAEEPSKHAAETKQPQETAPQTLESPLPAMMRELQGVSTNAVETKQRQEIASQTLESPLPAMMSELPGASRIAEESSSRNDVGREHFQEATSQQTLESPLPAMMSELQEAMAASAFSADESSSEGHMEGLPLDEESQLRLALFLSKEEKERADQAAAAAADEELAAAAAAEEDEWQATFAAAVEGVRGAAGEDGQSGASATARAPNHDSAANRGRSSTSAQGQLSAAHALANEASAAAQAAASAAEALAHGASSSAGRSVAQAIATAEQACNKATAAAAGAVEASRQQAEDFVGRQASSVQSLLNDVESQMHSLLATWPGYRGPARLTADASGIAQPEGPVAEADLAEEAESGLASDNRQEQHVDINAWQPRTSSDCDLLFDLIDNSPPAVAAASAAATTAAAQPQLWSVSSDDSIIDLTTSVSERDSAVPVIDLTGFDNVQGPGAPVDQFAALSLMDAAAPATPGASVSLLDALDLPYLPEEQSDSPFFEASQSSFVMPAAHQAADSAAAVPSRVSSSESSFVMPAAPHAAESAAAVLSQVSSATADASDFAPAPTIPETSHTTVDPLPTAAPLTADQHEPISYPQLSVSLSPNHQSSSSHLPDSPICYPQIHRSAPTPTVDQMAKAIWTAHQNMPSGGTYMATEPWHLPVEPETADQEGNSLPPFEWPTPAEAAAVPAEEDEGSEEDECSEEDDESEEHDRSEEEEQEGSEEEERSEEDEEADEESGSDADASTDEGSGDWEDHELSEEEDGSSEAGGESAAEPASIHVHQEQDDPLANNRLAALSGHGQLTQEDSSEWEIVSSDVDEE